MSNVKIHITMFAIGDADAIIVQLWKESRSLVMVIDGGKAGDFERRIEPALDRILPLHGKAAPDIVVCTHYDNDHIGGLIPLVEKYGEAIGEVWVHRIPGLLIPLMNEGLKREIAADVTRLIIERDVTRDEQVLVERDQILESVRQLDQFLSRIPKRSIRPVFGFSLPLEEEWPEIAVLGPSRSYFNSLFNNDSPQEFLISESVAADFNHHPHMGQLRHLVNMDPCLSLDNDGTARQTATNRSSIIIRITVNNQRYLFTGDASVQSFENLPGYPECISNLHFLKIPHHGSANNISHDIIRTMHPEVAFNSGSRRESPDVIACIRNTAHAIVQTTRLRDDLEYPWI